MIVAAVCPPAPLLIRGLAPRLAAECAELVAAVNRAVSALAAADHVLVVSAGERAAVRHPGAQISAAAFARFDSDVVPVRSLPTSGDVSATDDGSSAVGRPADDAATGTIVAAHLLADAGVTVPVTAWEMPAAGADLSGLPVVDPGALGVLLMVNGAAAHSVDAPAGHDGRAEQFDAELVRALASGSPSVLAEACEVLAPLASRVRCDDLPLLSAFAASAPPHASADVLHYSAPLGIGYPVVTWTWARDEPWSES